MAPITCNECGQEIPDQDINPAGPTETPSRSTKKGFVWQSVLSLTLIFIGIIWGLVEFLGIDQQSPSSVPLVLLLIGFIWYVINRLLLWRRYD